MAKLAALGEIAFVEAIAALAKSARAPGDAVGKRRRPRGVTVGIGDDAAVVVCSRATILTTDTQREGVHFRRDWLAPRALGRRAFRIAVSDVAAMGGVPRYVLLAFGAPPSLDARWATSVVAGLIDDARAHGAVIVGGNVSEDDAVSLAITVIADAAAVRPVLRSGARIGDRIWVTGTLGAAAAGVELLEAGERRGALVEAYRNPPVRLDVARALARRRLATSMIDVSDGLLHDLSHVCRSSRLGARLDVGAIPVAPALVRATGAQSRASRQRGEAAAGERHGRAGGELGGWRTHAHCDDRAGVCERGSGALYGLRPGRHDHGRAGEAKERAGRCEHDDAHAALARAREAIEYALGGGDDYELVFTTAASPKAERAVRAVCEAAGCMVRPIGTMERARRAPGVVDLDGHPLAPRGYVHFGRRS